MRLFRLSYTRSEYNRDQAEFWVTEFPRTCLHFALGNQCVRRLPGVFDNLIDARMKSNQKLSVMFWLKKSKATKDRGKTGVSEMVPILPIVETLIAKYRKHSYYIKNKVLMLVNSNARYNGYLKELAIICEINRELNTHLSRHTFADMMLNNVCL